MAVKVKVGGAYTDPVGVFAKVSGSYSAVTVNAKAADAYQNLSSINGFTYSEQFDNAVWQKNAATCTPNTTIAPDGTLTADTLTTTGTDATLFYRPAPGATAQTVSVHLKRVDADWAYLFMDNGFRCVWFNLLTGALGTQSAGVSGAIAVAANGYYRCSITGLIDGTGNTGWAPCTVNGSSGVASGINLAVWGAQLDAGAITTYKPRTT